MTLGKYFNLCFQNWDFQGLGQINDFSNCFSQEGSLETTQMASGGGTKWTQFPLPALTREPTSI